MKNSKKRKFQKQHYQNNNHGHRDMTNIHILEVSFEEGKRNMQRLEEGKDVTRSCFFCRRSEDFISAHMQVKPGKIEVIGAKQPLFPILRQLGDFIFHFKLCFDCSILFSGRPVEEN